MTGPVAGGPVRADAIIDGTRVASRAGTQFDVLNPADGSLVGRAARCGPSDVDDAVTAARSAAPGWSAASPADRVRALARTADAMADRQEELARLLACETGNAIRPQSRPEIASAVEFVRYFAATPYHVEGRTTPLGDGLLNYTVREPLGVVGAIIPWNSPVLIAVMKLAMAISTGNTVVLKTAEDAPLAATEVAAEFNRFLPPGVVNVVHGTGRDCGTALVEHPGTDKLTFTGSTEVGRSVGASAGRRVVPVSLELGGKSPTVVFADSDEPSVARGVIAGMRFTRQGQSCTAGSRLFVHRSIFESFTAKLVQQLEQLRLGDPLDEATDMGALINLRQYERVRGLLAEAMDLGAQAATGSLPPSEPGPGLFMNAVLLTGAEPDWRIVRDEVFGPVLVAIPWDDEEEVTRWANDTPYGLAAYVWTHDISAAHRMAQRLDAGWVQINRGLGQLPGMTYGGFKHSGVGSECSIEAALAAYTRTKTVTVGL